MDRLFKLCVVLLLAGILIEQLLILKQITLILRQIPPPVLTVADLVNAPPDKRKELLLRESIVRINGNVTVDGAVDCSILDTPLDVQIVNAPLDVQIVR